MLRLQEKIRSIPDFPQPGIIFRDITPLLRDPPCMKLCVHKLIAPFLGQPIDAVAGMEARGFIFGTLAAWELGVGFIPLRKPGKLPFGVERESYDLEYGTASLEIHTDALREGARVLLVDDLLATGGTAKASCSLLERLGAEIIACAFVIELDALDGRTQLERHNVHTLLHY